ncbi:MAG: hypothetical protein K6A33_06445 [Clostridiales bacterium]|nr:hypothetical protein [Clostridiales bacterium]
MAGRWEWRGISYPFDITDAGCIAAVSGALGRVREALARCASEKPAETGPLDTLASDAADYCALVEVFFSALFGEGAAEALFGGRRSMEEHGEAYASFAAYAAGELERLEGMRRAAEERYGGMADALGPADADDAPKEAR